MYTVLVDAYVGIVDAYVAYNGHKDGGGEKTGSKCSRNLGGRIAHGPFRCFSSTSRS